MSRLSWCCAVAFAAMVVMLPGTADPYQTPRLLALGVVALLLCLQRGQHRSILEPFILAGLAGWAVAAAFSADTGYSFVGSWPCPFDSFTAVAVYAALAVGAARMGVTVDDAAEAVTIMVLPVAVYAMASDVTIGGRAVGTQGSPHYLAIVLGMGIVCAAHTFPRRRILAACAIALAIPALWFTGSRAPLLGLLAAFLVLAPGRLRWAALLAVPALLLHPRAGSVGSFSDLCRFELWKSCWPMFLDNPVTGTGPGTFGMAFRQYITPAFSIIHKSGAVSQMHAHNEVLQVMVTQGLVGLAGYLAVVYGMFKTARENRHGRFLAALAAAYAIPAMLNPAPHAAVALLALVFGAASARTCTLGSRSWAYAAMAACSLALVARVALGDWHYADAVRNSDQVERAVSSMRRAVRFNPWEMRIASQRWEAETAMARTGTPREHAEGIWAFMMGAREQVRLHPADSYAHEMLGRATLYAAIYGLNATRAEAARHFADARRLSPSFPPLMRRQAVLARLMNDKRTRNKANADLERAAAWVRGGI